MTTRRDLRLPAHWLPADVRSRPSVRRLLAPDPRWFLTDSQKRQIGLLRLLLRAPAALLILGAAATLFLSPSRRR